MKLYIITALCLALSALKPDSQADNDPKTDFKQFLREAVTSGLAENQVPDSIANRLLGNNKLWVGKCPICDNVKAGLREYIKSEKTTDTRQAALATGQLDMLTSTNDSIAKAGLKDLVDMYVQRYYKVLNMPEAEIAAMDEQLLGGRKQGMSVAGGADGFYCASCDGACHKPDKE